MLLPRLSIHSYPPQGQLRLRGRTDSRPTPPMGGCGHPSADTSWPVAQAAPFADRRPVGDGAALAAPGDVTAARACDGADQHPARSGDARLGALSRRSPSQPELRAAPRALTSLETARSVSR
jgi:hypothetical protein